MRPEAPERRPRRNHEIRTAKVRLISEDGSQLGVVWLREALDAAEESGLDLIEVAPEADPPVCRIMDWGRFRYEQKQRERDQRKKQRHLEVKGLRLRPATGPGDFGVTRRKAERFLRDGHKVRIEVRFRGREITHREFGQGILDRLVRALEGVCEVEQDAILEGKKMFLLIAPRPEIIGTSMSAEDEALAASDALAEVDDEDDDDALETESADGVDQADEVLAASDAVAGEVQDDEGGPAPETESDDVAKVEQATDKAEDAEA